MTTAPKTPLSDGDIQRINEVQSLLSEIAATLVERIDHGLPVEPPSEYRGITPGFIWFVQEIRKNLEDACSGLFDASYLLDEKFPNARYWILDLDFMLENAETTIEKGATTCTETLKPCKGRWHYGETEHCDAFIKRHLQQGLAMVQRVDTSLEQILQPRVFNRWWEPTQL